MLALVFMERALVLALMTLPVQSLRDAATGKCRKKVTTEQVADVGYHGSFVARGTSGSELSSASDSREVAVIGAAGDVKFSQDDLDQIYEKHKLYSDSSEWQESNGQDPDGLWLASTAQNCLGRWVYFAPSGGVYAFKNHTPPQTPQECLELDPQKLPPENTDVFAFKFDKFETWTDVFETGRHPCKDEWEKEYGDTGGGLQHYVNSAPNSMLLPTKNLVQQGASYTCLRDSHISQGKCSSKEGEKLTLDTVLVKGTEDAAEWFAQSISERFTHVYVDCAILEENKKSLTDLLAKRLEDNGEHGSQGEDKEPRDPDSEAQRGSQRENQELQLQRSLCSQNETLLSITHLLIILSLIW